MDLGYENVLYILDTESALASPEKLLEMHNLRLSPDPLNPWEQMNVIPCDPGVRLQLLSRVFSFLSSFLPVMVGFNGQLGTV